MIFELLQQAAAREGQRSGLEHRGVFEPYDATLDRVLRLATTLTNRDLSRGDVVLVLLPNSPDHFVALHALFAIGAVAMPLSTAATLSEWLQAARKVEARAIVTTPQLQAAAISVAEGMREGSAIPVVVIGEETVGAGVPLLSQIPVLEAATPAIYLLSSGSTGTPKVVPHTHAELIADAHRAAELWSLGPDDRVFNVLPGNFAMGALLSTLDAALAGATTVYWSSPGPMMLARESLAQELDASSATVLGAVPFVYDAILESRTSVAFRSLRLAYSGGVALRRPTYEGFKQRFGRTIRQAYGSTEAILVSHNDAEDVDASWSSVGRPGRDVEVGIDRTATPFSDVGELLIRSPSVMKGYLDASDENRLSFADDGWFRTGDLARVDETAQLYIVGRIKLLIEVAGLKVDPIEVEELVLTHPAVAEVALVGIPRRESGESILKLVAVRKHDVTADEILAFARARLSSHKVPSIVEFRDALPRSSSGKLLRGQVV